MIGEELIKRIEEKTGFSRKKILGLAKSMLKENKVKLTDEGALFKIAEEYHVDLSLEDFNVSEIFYPKKKEVRSKFSESLEEFERISNEKYQVDEMIKLTEELIKHNLDISKVGCDFNSISTVLIEDKEISKKSYLKAIKKLNSYQIHVLNAFFLIFNGFIFQDFSNSLNADMLSDIIRDIFNKIKFNEHYFMVEETHLLDLGLFGALLILNLMRKHFEIEENEWAVELLKKYPEEEQILIRKEIFKIFFSLDKKEFNDYYEVYGHLIELLFDFLSEDQILMLIEDPESRFADNFLRLKRDYLDDTLNSVSKKYSNDNLHTLVKARVLNPKFKQAGLYLYKLQRCGFFNNFTPSEYYSLFVDDEVHVLEDFNKKSGWFLSYIDDFDSRYFPGTVFTTKNRHVTKIRFFLRTIDTLPDSIGDLKYLTHLYLGKSEVQFIPDSIGDLESLKVLELNENDIHGIPETILNLSNLEVLDLSRTRMKKIPKNIGNMQKLRVLKMNTNKIFSVPYSIVELKNLEILEIAYNDFYVIPNKIGNLSSLKELDISGNRLEAVPSSIGNLSSLKRLDLSRNLLREIPSSIGNLRNLEYLLLNENNLAKLPESIIGLKSLIAILLQENKFNLEDDMKLKSIIHELEKNGTKLNTLL